MHPVEVNKGDGPIILGLPHTGTAVPQNIRSNLTPIGQTLADTDWHVDRLYQNLLPAATTVRATFHRYVIDANRDPDGQSLYPGQNTTELVPLTDFDGKPLWLKPINNSDVQLRRAQYHAVYHAALEEEIQRVRAKHGVALLFDCHSIRSLIPYLFEGTLPDFNIGTNEGRTCAPQLENQVIHLCSQASQYSTTVNKRFKGGWTTRHYGQPDQGVHAIQMELAQSTYLHSETAPFDYDPNKAKTLRVVLSSILNSLSEQVLAFNKSA